MTRLDEREIAGASENIDNAPDLIELRKSNRTRVVKRHWEQAEASKPRKRRRLTKLPTPTSTQTTSQTFTIYDEEQQAAKSPTPEINSSDSERENDTKNSQKNQKLPAWHRKYLQLKRDSKSKARDYLIEIIGHDSFEDVLRVPQIAPEVLLEDAFNPQDPLSVWRKFISKDDLQQIASHTNLNARAALALQASQRVPGLQKARRWKKVTSTEIGGYFGALFLLGTQGAASLTDNWNVSEDSPLYPIRTYISLNRFQQISRYLKINQPGKTNDNLKDKDFWLKVDPLVTSFRQRCRANLRPGNTFSIDEQLRRNQGRWKHALQISSKVESKGVKIYSICAGYYCFDFIYASKVVAVPEAREFTPNDPTAKPFSMSERVVLTLVERLQNEHPDKTLHLTLTCDNFFTTQKLFEELKARGISAYGTAKDGSGMAKQHILLRDCTDKKQDYGLICNSVVSGVNQVTFIDQKAVHMMTTAHDVINEDPHWRDASTRRKVSLQRARETAGQTELPYPQVSHDYNHGMNSCDVASQVWSYYSVSRYSHWRNWWPMLWIILDASIANVLYLYRLKGYTEANLSHRELQTRIGLQLLKDPASVLRKRSSKITVSGQEPSVIPQPQHRWIKAGITARGYQHRGECKECKPSSKRGRPPPNKEDRQPLQEISLNTCGRRQRVWSSFKCSACDVWLCRDSTCWQRHHANLEDQENVEVEVEISTPG
jgi:hypothetical protein